LAKAREKQQHSHDRALPPARAGLVDFAGRRRCGLRSRANAMSVLAV
jgi:hypothetical protein